MTINTQLSDRTVNRQAQAIIDDLNAGYLRIYSGPQPLSADVPISSQILLAEQRFGSPAAPAPLNGVISFSNPVARNALADEKAVFYRYFMADGSTAILDGSVGTANANMVLSNTKLVAGAKVTLTNLTHTVNKSASGY